MKGKIICNLEVKNAPLWVEGNLYSAIELFLIKGRSFLTPPPHPVLEYEVSIDFNSLINSDLVIALACGF